MKNSPNPDAKIESVPEHSRWRLMRDVLVFQLKLFIDGLRDLLMSPISLVAGIGGLLFRREQPELWFEQTLDLGRRSEVWINLFGRRSFKQRNAEHGFDELVGQVEARLLDQYERGGVTAQAKSAIDKAIDALQESVNTSQPKSKSDA